LKAFYRLFKGFSKVCYIRLKRFVKGFGQRAPMEPDAIPRGFHGASIETQGGPRQSSESLKRAQESSKESKVAQGILKRARREPKTALREPQD